MHVIVINTSGVRDLGLTCRKYSFARHSYHKDVYVYNRGVMRCKPWLAWVAPKERFDSSMVRLWFESTAPHLCTSSSMVELLPSKQAT